MNNLDKLNQLPHLAQDDELLGKKSYSRQIGRWLLGLMASLITLSFLAVLLLRWINPPTTSFMLQRQYTAWAERHDTKLQHKWVDWEQISPHVKVAAVTHEDQSFATHWGLDLSSIQKAINEYERGQDLRGASTITQQVAKNLFLWPAQSFLRKGIEAYFALLIELLWSKERILEVYLNIVEFGDRVYGVQAAANRYFDTTAARLTKYESALMVTALPAPKRYNLGNPSSYMINRSQWVLRYMDFLGNAQYLEKLE